MTSPGVPINSSSFFDNARQRLQEKDQNPYGSAENHPGWLGKVAHGLAKAGNIALDVAAPATAALIPETDLGRRAQEGELTGEANTAREAELAKQTEGVKERQEDTREQHEENYRQHQLTQAQQADEKIAAIFRGLDIKGDKVDSDQKKWMRAYGIQPDPNKPGGFIDIPDDQLSPEEKNKAALGQALFHAREARAGFDEYRANPNSPTAQAALIRAQAARESALAASQRAGIAAEEFSAKFLGTDKYGNPIAGVQTDAAGKPIGTEVTKSNATGQGKVAEAWEKNYNKPANDVERAYQMYQEALQEYNSGNAKTGAATMLALSQHLNTTFGQVKGSRMNRDLIQEHRDAIGALDRLELEAGKLAGRGDQLTADQMVEFGRLIQNMRHLTWETATKEALRHGLPVDFLPQGEEKLADMPKPKDLRQPARPANSPAASTTPPANLVEGHTRSNPRTGEVQKYTGGKWQTITPPRAAPAQQ